MKGHKASILTYGCENIISKLIIETKQTLKLVHLHIIYGF